MLHLYIKIFLKKQKEINKFLRPGGWYSHTIVSANQFLKYFTNDRKLYKSFLYLWTLTIQDYLWQKPIFVGAPGNQKIKNMEYKNDCAPQRWSWFNMVVFSIILESTHFYYPAVNYFYKTFSKTQYKCPLNAYKWLGLRGFSKEK